MCTRSVRNFESILDTTEICSFNLDYGRQQYCAGGISKSYGDAFSTGDLRVLSVDGGFYGEIEEAGSMMRVQNHEVHDLIIVAIDTLQPDTWA